MEAILRAAAETGTALEINAHPSRLDLWDGPVRRAVELGVKLAINTDAHDAREFDNLAFGVGTARRGWAPPDLIINTWNVEELMAWLSRRKGDR